MRMLRNFGLVFLALLVPLAAGGQDAFDSFGKLGGGGFTSPGAGIPVDTDGSSTWVARCLAAGTGISVANACGAAGNITVSLDGSTTPQFSSGTGSASASGEPGTFYFETDAGLVSTYSASNTLATFMTTQTHFIDEDSFASDSATKVPSQQSVKAYVDAEIAGVGSTFDPSTSIDLYDEFLSGLTSTGNIGNLGWAFQANNTGTVAVGTTAVAAHPGLFRLNSHASNDNSGAAIELNNQAGTASTISFESLAGTDWTLDMVVLPGANSTAITSAAFWVGFCATGSLDSCSGGIYARYDPDRSDAFWIFQVCDANSAQGCQAAGDDTDSAVVTSTIAPVAGTYNRVRIRQLQVGVGGLKTIYFRVNNETEVTFCSSGCNDVLADSPVAGHAFLEFGYFTRTTTGVLSGEIDYMRFTMAGLTRY